jgi:hypothetical protein
MSKPDQRSGMIVAKWLLVALGGFGLILFTEAAVQQNYRMSANDPQIQMAEDAAAALSHGASPDSLLPNGRVDQEQSLAPFIIIINKQRQIVATSADRGSDSALPPVGVFDNVDAHGEQRLSWQTGQGVRFATVVAPATNGYVIAARSLKEVESREHNLAVMGGLTLIGYLFVTFLAVVVIR